MGKLYKRGATWWGYYSPTRGEYLRTSLRTADRDVAKHRLKQLEIRGDFAEAHQAEDEVETGPALEEAVSAFLASHKNKETRSCYETKGRHVERLLGEHRKTGSITKPDIVEYIKAREQEGAHPNTITKELTVLKGALRIFGFTPEFPAYRAKYVPRKRYITKDQFRRMMPGLLPHRQQWFAVACYTGLRDSEIENLQPTDIDWNMGTINVWSTASLNAGEPRGKTSGAMRVVPIADEVRPFLKKLPVRRWESVRRSLSAVARRTIGYGPKEFLTPNDLRRTFASWLLQDGVPPHVVSRLLGHKSTKMVELVYGHLDLETMRRAVQGLRTDGVQAAWRSKSPESFPVALPDDET